MCKLKKNWYDDNLWKLLVASTNFLKLIYLVKDSLKSSIFIWKHVSMSYWKYLTIFFSMFIMNYTTWEKECGYCHFPFLSHLTFEILAIAAVFHKFPGILTIEKRNLKFRHKGINFWRKRRTKRHSNFNNIF
jgi:hypothetical protein